MSRDVLKGRGAQSAPPGRFAASTVDVDPDAEVEASHPDTTLRAMRAGRIISRNNSPDIPFDQSINPYQGCEHGCVYCYARPTHSYLDLSPGLDFETRIFYKPNAVSRLLAEWEKPAYDCQPITIGANTDPYQPAEKSLELTRELLQTFLEHRHPVSLITKGALMKRDLDVLEKLAARRLVSVAVSIPTADRGLKRVLEPRVPSAEARFSLVSALADAGVPVSVMLAPVIPAINDTEIEAILERASEAGATHANWILLRLPHEVKDIFEEWLEAHLPDRASHVMSLLRQASGGRAYDARFGVRQRGRGPYAAMIAKRFTTACARLGLNASRGSRTLDTSQFRRPGQSQLALDLG